MDHTPVPPVNRVPLRGPLLRLLLAALLCLASVAATPPPAGRPNILFIMSDDHAAQSMSCYGSQIARTPQLDRLATAGMRFTHCFAVNSICTPSRATILTGKYSHLNGVPVFNRFDGRQSHVAKLLREAGYQTGMIGKWHLFSDPTGFDYWNVLPGQGDYDDPVMIENGVTNHLKGYVTDLITDLSIDFLKRRDPTRPFLLFTHHKATHRPWKPDAAHATLYEEVLVPEPPTFQDSHVGRSAAAAEATMRIERDLTPTDLKEAPPEGLSEAGHKRWNYQRYIKDYLRCAASLDDNVGRLLDYLDQTGLATNTIVIYTSDQGFFLGEHGWFDKRFMYEESIRMPLLVRYPGRIPPRTVNSNMVLNVDFAPTFLEVAGLRPPADMQGRSLWPMLRGEVPRDWRESMYYRYYHYPGDHAVQPHYGVRTRTHKLIYFEELNTWELYDLQHDPLEMENRAEDPAYAPVRRRLESELARLRKELKDEEVRSPRLTLMAGGGKALPPTNAVAVSLNGPFGLNQDAAGNSYIVEMPGNRVVKVDPQQRVTVVAGDGIKGEAGDGGPGVGARLNAPHSIALSGDGTLYIADSWNNRIRALDTTTGILRGVAGTGAAGFSGDGGAALQASFNGLYGIALDEEGKRLFLTDLENRRIRVVDLRSGVVQTVAGDGSRGVPRDGTPAVKAPLVDPRAVAVDVAGNIYILERGGNALRVVDRSGVIRTVVGTGAPGGEEAGEEARSARLRGPKDLWVDLDGSVLIADTDNHMVRRYDPRTRRVTRVAGTGRAGADGIDGPPEVCELNQPHGVWVNPRSGEIFISDSSNHRVLKLSRVPPATRQARVQEGAPDRPRVPQLR